MLNHVVSALSSLNLCHHKNGKFKPFIQYSHETNKVFTLKTRPELMAEARKAASKHGTKLLLCLGGNGRSGGFSVMVSQVWWDLCWI